MDELEKLGDVPGGIVKAGLEFFYGGTEVAPLAEENLKGVLQGADPDWIEAGPAQSHDVQPAHGMLPVDDGER
ncbi:MAG: hypothetical protein OXE53_22730, partial [Deltaproteobacteria bacterium]|nr:hypothetical protein [Deltaproteobacteria bacterium]